MHLKGNQCSLFSPFKILIELKALKSIFKIQREKYQSADSYVRKVKEYFANKEIND
jgi:hypothetical protein